MKSRNSMAFPNAGLSDRAKSLWAKSPQVWDKKETPEGGRLLLYKHMADSYEMGKCLWKYWISPAVKSLINQDQLMAERLFLFFVAAHDVGKATPEFQSKKTRDNLLQYVDNSLSIGVISDKTAVPHSLAGHIILEEYLMSEPLCFLQEEAESFASVIGGHHGKSWESGRIYDGKVAFSNNTGFRSREWCTVQNELLTAALSLSGLDFEELSSRELAVRVQVILTGLVIMTDWLASNEELFPYESLEHPRKKSSAEYAQDAWEKLNFPSRWVGEDVWSDKAVPEFFRSRFRIPEGAAPYPVQEAVIDLVKSTSSPGIVVIEAPMGEGKTEAALLAAEILARKTNRRGVFFALPTQATSDGIFPRITKWMDKLDDRGHSVFLAHSKSEFNEEYQALEKVWIDLNVWDEDVDEQSERAKRQHNASVHEWMQGRKRGVLADFVVGTIDQVLMGALKQKHLALRHLGLYDKVVIIDECHAYDAYMSQYLEGVLGWLGLYGVPTVILSATLPSCKREALVNAYLGRKKSKQPVDWAPRLNAAKNATEDMPISENWANTRAYPVLTYSDGQEVRWVCPALSGRKTEVELEFLDDDIDTLIKVLSDSLSEGGCVGIIRNTVGRAQETAQTLGAVFGEENVELFHSQFLSNDRARKEKGLRHKLGPEGNRPSSPFVVVGTQVLEQSLDIDFDLMITDLAPVDLLLQRMGRLHRHTRTRRPEKLRTAKCLVTGIRDQGESLEFESGSEAIYGRYLLMGTYLRLQGVRKVVLPADIPDLVQDVYQQGGVVSPEKWREGYQSAKDKHDEGIRTKEIKAKVFRIREARTADSLIGWLSTPAGSSEAQAEATVRDASDSLEVIVVYRDCQGHIRLLPWVTDESELLGSEIPTACAPQNHLARTIAGCTVRLPSILCAPWLIDRVIEELESNAWPYVAAWQESPWLKGALVLILSEEYEAELCGYRLRYDETRGLSAEKKEG